MQKAIFTAILLLLFATQVGAEEEPSPWLESYEKISYSELRKLIDDGQIEEARVLNDGWWVTVKTKDGDYFDTRVTPQTPIADHFYDAGVTVSIRHNNIEGDELPKWLSLFLNILPLLIFFVFFAVIMFFMRKANGGYYSRAEKMQADFFERLEKLLTEHKDSNG